MTLRLLVLIVAAAAVSLLSGRASDPSSDSVTVATILDFQALQHTGIGYTDNGNAYREKGFVITANGVFNTLDSWNTGASQYRGSPMLFNNADSNDTILARDDGGQFNFFGMDLAPLSTIIDSGIIRFRGYRDTELV